MDKVISLQMSLFGTFMNIKLETEIVIKLLTALKDNGFVPASADITSFDLQTGKMTVDSRMQMISPDKTWAIVFLPDRIDFNYNYQLGTSTFKSIDKLLEYGNDLVEKVFSVFQATTGNRLALNCKMALENMTDGDLKQFCDRFTKPLSAYNQESYAEWSVRFNARGKVKVSDQIEEECNRIAEMTQIENQNIIEESTVGLHRVIISLDINTMALELEQRFRYENLIYFTNNAKDFIAKVVNEIEKG